ncbi:nucleotidyltransferase domain-containing protein [Patescibacteria group bacterium]|nr:nucleotidyltransferase domain-containing protein [Candidatus Falkowbacteria bacterium]MBU3906248.1 nucleotidyltransferase domain-containing protein [Patescibacteria group bacterium]MCG2697880.1 nucleotidyltransferase domain-containing protein [Candidatus Parcubacteria bacterium]MBU4015700.1 nucleotidyltransferase domain-containing protein [Patescibacteria group bacterium]MBU4026877.1 nucleotidyltransferase domain-containing protein [Patescibacteria group bacterium]
MKLENYPVKKTILQYKYKQKIKTLFEKERVVLCFLFGSQAKGLAHKESDIDIGILFDRKVKPKSYLRKEGELIGFFSKIFPNHEINIVNLNSASPLLRQTVNLEGKLIYRKNKISFMMFQINALREYEEYVHLSNIYNQFLKLKLNAL